MDTTNMKRALQIGLAFALLALAYGPVKRVVAPQCENPKAWYDGFNETYFENRLPANTVVDYSNHDSSVLAVTTQDGDHFRIAFNRDYAASAPVVHVFLLHEMCHVDTFDEEAEHGPRWIACMRGLEAKGAIDDNMVKVYE